MVHEKRTYQLWERPPHSPSWHGLWQRHRFAVLFTISVFASLIVGSWVNHTLAGLSILVETIWMESALTGVSGLFLILLILFPRKQRGGT